MTVFRVYKSGDDGAVRKFAPQLMGFTRVRAGLMTKISGITFFHSTAEETQTILDRVKNFILSKMRIIPKCLYCLFLLTLKLQSFSFNVPFWLLPSYK